MTLKSARDQQAEEHVASTVCEGAGMEHAKNCMTDFQVGWDACLAEVLSRVGEFTHNTGSTDSGKDTSHGRAFDAGYLEANRPEKYSHTIGPKLSDIDALTLATWFAIGARWQHSIIIEVLKDE